MDVFDTSARLDLARAASHAWKFDLGRVTRIAREVFGEPENRFLLLLLKPRFRLDERHFAAGLQFNQLNLFVYGFNVVRLHRRDVFDLRTPFARRWLFESYAPSVRDTVRANNQCAAQRVVVVGSETAEPTSFVDLVPTLLTPFIGGGHPFLQSLGLFLRTLGCGGLVYPSARCDSSAHAIGAKVRGSTGWNFVDLEGAPPSADDRSRLGEVWTWNEFYRAGYSAEVSSSADGAETIRTRGVSARKPGTLWGAEASGVLGSKAVPPSRPVRNGRGR
jgi:hypothetical protein